jgi:PAS domain S-box-containing protein
MSDVEIQLLQSFCDAVPVGVCLIDLRGKIVQWNRAAECISGYSGSEVLGKVYRGDLLVRSAANPSTFEKRSPLTEVLREGKPQECVLYLRHRLGNLLNVHVQAFALRDAMGVLTGAGEIFSTQDSPVRPAGRSDHEFEVATGLAAVEETRLELEKVLTSQSASSAAVILIDLPELDALLHHGGSGMLHQAIRVLAKTVSGVMPPRHRVGCWNDWKLIAIAQDCPPETLKELMITLRGIGSSCAVKWWGDRVEIAIRAVACNGDSTKTVDEIMQELEQKIASGSDRND